MKPEKDKGIKVKKNRIEKLSSAISYCMALFLVALFVIYPLYFKNKYYNMGDAKYFFVKNVGMIVFSVVGLLTVIWFFSTMKEDLGKYSKELKRISITDCFVMGYFLVVTISMIATDYKTVAVWGYDGWFMGYVAQVFFCLIYFYLSRSGICFFDTKKTIFRFFKIILGLSLVVAAIVYILAILHRFQIDPLGFYEGLSERNKIEFLSTIGQATWYSSYVVILLPI